MLRRPLPFARALLAGSVLSVATVSACSSGSGATGVGSSSGSGSGSASDQLTVKVNALVYTYECAEQPLDKTAGPRIVTTGCGWPSTSPRIEIDFALRGNEPMRDVSIDLSSPLATDRIFFTVGLAEQQNLANLSIYSAFDQGGVGVPAGTSGLITVRSYDPSSGTMDVVATNVTLPVSSLDSYPGAPSTLTVESAEILR